MNLMCGDILAQKSHMRADVLFHTARPPPGRWVYSAQTVHCTQPKSPWDVASGNGTQCHLPLSWDQQVTLILLSFSLSVDALLDIILLITIVTFKHILLYRIFLLVEKFNKLKWPTLKKKNCFKHFIHYTNNNNINFTFLSTRKQ